jgi:hypothetical protein
MKTAKNHIAGDQAEIRTERLRNTRSTSLIAAGGLFVTMSVCHCH